MGPKIYVIIKSKLQLLDKCVQIDANCGSCDSTDMLVNLTAPVSYFEYIGR